MAFVQVIEFNTADIDAIRRVDEEWRRATEGKRTVRREILARDRNRPGRFVVIVFFDSPEAAAENSNLPETQAAAERYMTLADGPPVFSDLDILEDRA
jgi:quinol monooxygenase YgiN